VGGGGRLDADFVKHYTLAGKGAAMAIQELELVFHVGCFACHDCGAGLGDGQSGADVRVLRRRLLCQPCYERHDD